jgi:Zn-dependent protease/predicted transcriptional regulator
LWFGGVVAHELCHVALALRAGLHVRAVRIYMFGGYSVIDGSPTPKTEALIAAAGPAASLTGAVLSGVAGLAVGFASPWGRALAAVALANAAIGLYNLLPGFPLDGGRVVRGVLVHRGMDRVGATRIVIRLGSWIGWGSVAAGTVLLVLARSPWGLFLIAGGWFVSAASADAGRREQLSAAFDGMTVRDVMRETHDAVPANLTISNLVDVYAVGPRLRSLPVEMDGRVVGVIGQDEIDGLAPGRWVSTRVRSAMTAIGPADVVTIDTPLEALLLVPAGASRRVIVTDDGVAVGIIEGADLARVLAS